MRTLAQFVDAMAGGEMQASRPQLQQHGLQLVRQIGDVAGLVGHEWPVEAKVVLLGDSLLGLDDGFRHPRLEFEQTIDRHGIDLFQFDLI